MEQLFTFIAEHPILVGAFAVVLAALIATESARLTRKWKELDTAQAILLMNRRDPLILDVSNSSDFAKGHIMNAEHMPPSRIESGNARLLKQTSRPVLLYDKNGQVAPQMAKRLVQLGFEDVNVLRGGLAQWTSDQQPVTRGKSGKGGKSDKSGKSGKSGKSERKDKDRKRKGGGQAGRADAKSDRGRTKPAGEKPGRDAGSEAATSGDEGSDAGRRD